MRLFFIMSVLMSFILCSVIAVSADVVQLIEVSSLKKADWFQQYSDEDLAEIQKIKSQIITFVKSPPKSQLKLLSEKYKGIFQNTEKELLSAFDKESYSKIDFRKINYSRKGNATVKANLYWELEGYEGLQTFFFKMVKDNENWLIDWLVY